MEEDVIRRMRDGDERAFKLVFDLYYRPLTVFAIKYVGDVEDAKEIVQEFFVRMWSKQATLDIRFSLRMYLYQSVRNACLNFIASDKVEKKRMMGYNYPLVSNDNALEHMMAAEQEEILMQAIDRLPEKCREIFVMSRMNRLSHQAIATQLNISVKTVETQISIALKRLAEWVITLAMFCCDALTALF
nr:RNA polymerase sigma-70 factor [Chryseolinea lacunae]